MGRMFITLSVIATAAILAGMGGCASEETDDRAADFTLKSLDGKSVSLAELRGQVVLINFWAVGCAPCRAEAPHLAELQERHAGRGLRVLGVNAWNEPATLVKSFADSVKTPYPILLDGKEVFAEKYRGSAVPMNVLLDRKGNVALTQIGFDDERMRQLDRKIEALLGN